MTGAEREPSLWELQKQENPGHSQWYIQRFETMRAQGADLHGEARFMDALLPRGGQVLDAGSGPGRVGGELAARGHRVIGVDVDPELVEQARRDHPECSWLVGDLAVLPDLLGPELAGGFDAVVCAGNVMAFLAPSTRVEVLRGFRQALKPGGRAAVGFGAGRGYAFEDFFHDVETAGLEASLRLGTWDLEPLGEDPRFLVAVLRRPENPAAQAAGRTRLI